MVSSIGIPLLEYELSDSIIPTRLRQSLAALDGTWTPAAATAPTAVVATAGELETRLALHEDELWTQLGRWELRRWHRFCCAAAEEPEFPPLRRHALAAHVASRFIPKAQFLPATTSGFEPTTSRQIRANDDRPPTESDAAEDQDADEDVPNETHFRLVGVHGLPGPDHPLRSTPSEVLEDNPFENHALQPPQVDEGPAEEDPARTNKLAAREATWVQDEVPSEPGRLPLSPTRHASWRPYFARRSPLLARAQRVQQRRVLGVLSKHRRLMLASHASF
ncbi:hypothetical protein GNI_184840 [Gregarina niphandrodes]|uniref:Uncharacterized protein n=1 Tax=Gregarina niphandrodes TaxID=110365 RepID=A0A023AX33_GRENI|nr:hypothetical protein GNI_184840 [Gregarina niphandrodes]EZG43152.1 hypothetical protein GNI_184840 [Gregarina niphandrodes]|eukprot:XP_011133593.1 hypothetical protein GNI_184840 [Gregarina niphandrodes]